MATPMARNGKITFWIVSSIAINEAEHAFSQEILRQD
jgi:hypothetical protein